MSSRTALRAAALAVSALALTACNDPGGAAAGSAAPSAPASAAASAPAGKPSAPASAAAADHGLDSPPPGQARVAGLALLPWEWGNGFKESGKPSEDTSLALPALDASCHLTGSTPVKGLTGRMQRTVELPSPAGTGVSVFGWSEAEVFGSADASHRDFADTRAGAKRCPAYTDDASGDRFSGVHEVKAPSVAGADEVYAEEGTGVFVLADGKKSDPLPYVLLVARKGEVTFDVYADIDDGRGIAAARTYAGEAMRTLAIKF
ncbi:hypothetical protein [Kitasatospora paranensis]|uniref:hypothetical protein n=1 Tax=Kitasatospora paranensis TaxID=258053 RepID=UPI00360A55CB